MSQAPPLPDAAPGARPTDRSAGSRLAPRNWRVTTRLIVLVAIPTVLGLALAGLRVTGAVRSAQAYGQVSRLAALSEQVTGLTQAMADECSGAAAYVADGRPSAGLPALRRRYAITDDWAATVRRRIHQLGGGYPAQTRASTATALASIGEIPGLRRQVAQGQTAVLTVINGYSAATAGLFAVNDGIADLSGNSGLIISVRALGALSRMKDEVSQQQAILGAALAEGHFEPGGLTALTTAQAQQASDLVSFRSSASPEESWALTTTLASPRPRQAQALERRATAAGPGGLALGARAASQWQAGMSATVGWMRHAEQQLTGSLAAYAQALQRRAVESALITAGVTLAALALVVLATMIIARSLVLPLRRLEAATPEAGGAQPPAAAGPLGLGDVPASFLRRSHSLLERLLRLIDSSELTEDDPDRLASLFQMDHLATRMRRNAHTALVLAGHETPHYSAEPVTLVDVLRAAASEIEQYNRVVLEIQPGVRVSGSAVADTVHLLAELLDNATTFSPRKTQVIVSGSAAPAGGALITITDTGAGMPEERLSQLNWQLAHPDRSDMTGGQRMGFYAVAHLAARRGITVALGTPPGGGISAEVYLPATLISHDADPGAWLSPGGEVPRSGADFIPGWQRGVPRAEPAGQADDRAQPAGQADDRAQPAGQADDRAQPAGQADDRAPQRSQGR